MRIANDRTDRLYFATDKGLVLCLRERERDYPLFHKQPEKRPVEPEIAPEEGAKTPAKKPAAKKAEETEESPDANACAGESAHQKAGARKESFFQTVDQEDAGRRLKCPADRRSG